MTATCPQPRGHRVAPPPSGASPTWGHPPPRAQHPKLSGAKCPGPQGADERRTQPGRRTQWPGRRAPRPGGHTSLSCRERRHVGRGGCSRGGRAPGDRGAGCGESAPPGPRGPPSPVSHPLALLRPLTRPERGRGELGLAPGGRADSRSGGGAGGRLPVGTEEAVRGGEAGVFHGPGGGGRGRGHENHFHKRESAGAPG